MPEITITIQRPGVTLNTSWDRGANGVVIPPKAPINDILRRLNKRHQCDDAEFKITDA